MSLGKIIGAVMALLGVGGAYGMSRPTVVASYQTGETDFYVAVNDRAAAHAIIDDRAGLPRGSVSRSYEREDPFKAVEELGAKVGTLYHQMTQGEEEPRRDSIVYETKRWGLSVDQTVEFERGVLGQAQRRIAQIEESGPVQANLREHEYERGLTDYHQAQIARKMVDPVTGTVTQESLDEFWGKYQEKGFNELRLRMASPARPDRKPGEATIVSQADLAVRKYRTGQAYQEQSRSEDGARRTYAEASARSSIEEAEKAFGLR